ncbi:unnamed protein product [Soboliphyme baturini]|uniref:Riboflavin kinase n=1 Tax=Soboliphyme baturini TaxID=241478 RepID=A0A183IJX6_9BILA|nr:unnamed protein product [Soboliphyme baturini]
MQRVIEVVVGRRARGIVPRGFAWQVPNCAPISSGERLPFLTWYLCLCSKATTTLGAKYKTWHSVECRLSNVATHTISGEIVEQVEKFKYLGIVLTSDGKLEEEIDRRIGAASGISV